ncbi:hypothetical protein [Micromonospora sp. NPDC050695]|uniref:hypothetical protein n=1 Tax=Micromonospora sp. NPDC050695 TaxID=3154938 RepID=UPI0033D48AEA
MVTPLLVMQVFAALLLLVSVAFLGGVVAMRPPRPPEPVVADSPESVVTVELPRRSGPRTTSTIHAPQYRRSDDDTIVIERAGARR